MAAVDPRDLDRSPEMMAFFREVATLLNKNHGKNPDEAGAMIQRFFAGDVTPLERTLVMHRGKERVARALIEHPHSG